MTAFYINGNTIDNNSGTIMQVGATTRTDIQAAKPYYSHLKSDGNRAVSDGDKSTIRRGTLSPVSGILNISGYYGFFLNSVLTPGSTFEVTGASYPVNGHYRVTGSSGTYSVTSSPYISCTGIGASGSFTLSAGSFDAENQGQFIIMGSTSELAGAANTALQCFKGGTPRAIHKFEKYQSYAYSQCWECFGNSGSISPCDVTTTTVTFWGDEAISGAPTVTLSLGTKIQSAALENPDTTGLFNPGSGNADNT